MTTPQRPFQNVKTRIKDCLVNPVLVAKEADMMNTLKASYVGKSITLLGSVHQLPKETIEKGFHYYLVDEDEYAKVERKANKPPENITKAVILQDFNKFAKIRPKKMLYVRTLPPVNIGSKQCERRVFVDEALKVMMAAKEWEKASEEENRSFFVTWKMAEKQFEPDAPYLVNTVPVSEFIRFLEDLNINKEFITIVNDPLTDKTTYDMTLHGTVIRTYSTDARVVSDTHQAIYKVFQDLVCGVNWREPGLKELKKRVGEMFDELLRLHQAFYITHDYLNQKIDSIKREYPSVYTPREEDHLQTNNFFPKERLDKKFYYQIIAKYDLPNFEHCFPLQNTEFLTFLYRITTQYGWVKQFLRDGEYEPIRDLLVKNLMYLAPDPAKKDAKRFLIDQVYGDNPPPPQTRDEAVAARVRAVAPKPDESLSKEFEQAYISSLKKERAKKK